MQEVIITQPIFVSRKTISHILGDNHHGTESALSIRVNTEQPDRSNTDNWLSKKDLANHFSVSERTITNWMSARRVSYLRIGRTVRFNLQTVKNELLRGGLISSYSSAS